MFPLKGKKEEHIIGPAYRGSHIIDISVIGGPEKLAISNQKKGTRSNRRSIAGGSKPYCISTINVFKVTALRKL